MVTAIVNGVTRWRRRLDFTLDAMLAQGRRGAGGGGGVAGLDAPLRQLLRIGLFELAELKSELNWAGGGWGGEVLLHSHRLVACLSGAAQ